MRHSIVHGFCLSSPCPTECLALELRFGTHVQRLDDPGIDGRDHIHGTVEVCLRDARLPCVRKASFDSWLAVTHEGDCQPHEDLFTLAQVGHGMCITIKLPKIRALTHRFLHDSLFSHSLPL